MECKEIVFSRHAVQRLFERGVSKTDVRQIISEGRVIVDYPDDQPYPSALMLGFLISNEPLHVVVAKDASTGRCFVITAYRPDSKIWDDTFTIRTK